MQQIDPATPPMSRTTQIVTDDGVTLALHRIGPESAPPVLLISGTFSNHTFWLGTRGVGFARELAAAGFEACALDPRGHGGSQMPAPGDNWDFDHWARQDVPAAIRALAGEGKRPLVVGHSAGGAAALAALAAHDDLREQVAALAVIGTPLPWLQPWRGLGARVIRAVSRLQKRFPARLLKLGPEDELEGVMVQWMTWNIEGHWIGRDGTDYQAGFSRIRCPALIVAGSGDRFFAPPPACRGLFDLVGSEHKQWLLCGRESGFGEDFDHVSILVGRAAREEIWPKIRRWLEESAEIREI